MSSELLLGLLGLAVFFFVIDALLKTRHLLEKERVDYHQLHERYNSLQAALATRGKHLDVLLSMISEVVLRVDDSGRVLGGNEKAAEIFRFSKALELPQSMLIFYRDVEWIEKYQHAITALPERIELPEMQVRGRTFLPKLASYGENEALLICLDVTDFMQLQQKQRSLLENLMHDLKTPLTSLLGYARSIEAFADDEELRKEAVGVIAQEAKHINGLLNSMLTLNQIEHDKSKTNAASDVEEVCKQVWDSLYHDMQEKGVELVVEHEAESLQVAMAEGDLYRVLMNVAKNALRFSPANSKIFCRLQQKGSKVELTIQDQGPGISQAHIARVTERFYRVDGVRNRDKDKGHGLGLAIVKETLERDGGELKLSNAHEGGLIVRITLPQALKEKA